MAEKKSGGCLECTIWNVHGVHCVRNPLLCTSTFTVFTVLGILCSVPVLSRLQICYIHVYARSAVTGTTQAIVLL